MKALLGLGEGHSVVIDAPYRIVRDQVGQAWRERVSLCLPVEGRLFEVFRPEQILAVSEVPRSMRVTPDSWADDRLAA